MHYHRNFRLWSVTSLTIGGPVAVLKPVTQTMRGRLWEVCARKTAGQHKFDATATDVPMNSPRRMRHGGMEF
jgi:hypothetical protein